MVTINEAMVLMKAVRGRLGELSSLRSQCAKKESFFGETTKVIEPTYDVKVLDRKCVELENFLLDVEQKIKQSNAITKIEVTTDVKMLLEPLS